jgi:hypothetical protein
LGVLGRVGTLTLVGVPVALLAGAALADRAVVRGDLRRGDGIMITCKEWCESDLSVNAVKTS